MEGESLYFALLVTPVGLVSGCGASAFPFSLILPRQISLRFLLLGTRFVLNQSKREARASTSCVT